MMECGGEVGGSGAWRWWNRGGGRRAGGDAWRWWKCDSVENGDCGSVGIDREREMLGQTV